MSKLSIHVLPSTRRKLLNIEGIECLEPDRPLGPEHRLCFKVIMYAGLDLLKLSSWSDHQDAYQWVFQEDPLNVFSFSRLCEELGLEPGSVRKFFRVLVAAKDSERKLLARTLRRAIRMGSGC